MASQEKGLKIKESEGVYHLDGALDEFSDLSLLNNSSIPLKVNFSKLKNINSIGVRNFLQFLKGWGNKPLEYYDCPIILIDQINMIPALLGLGNRSGVVKSLMVPYVCTKCQNEEQHIEKMEKIDNLLDEQKLPERPCSRCKGVMEVRMAPEYFSFLQKSI